MRMITETRCQQCGIWIYLPNAWECARCDTFPMCSSCAHHHAIHPSHPIGAVGQPDTAIG